MPLFNSIVPMQDAGDIAHLYNNNPYMIDMVARAVKGGSMTIDQAKDGSGLGEAADTEEGVQMVRGEG
jgi:hypothetical protein